MCGQMQWIKMNSISLYDTLSSQLLRQYKRHMTIGPCCLGYLSSMTSNPMACKRVSTLHKVKKSWDSLSSIIRSNKSMSYKCECAYLKTRILFCFTSLLWLPLPECVRCRTVYHLSSNPSLVAGQSQYYNCWTEVIDSSSRWNKQTNCIPIRPYLHSTLQSRTIYTCRIPSPSVVNALTDDNDSLLSAGILYLVAVSVWYVSSISVPVCVPVCLFLSLVRSLAVTSLSVWLPSCCSCSWLACCGGWLRCSLKWLGILHITQQSDTEADSMRTAILDKSSCWVCGKMTRDDDRAMCHDDCCELLVSDCDCEWYHALLTLPDMVLEDRADEQRNYHCEMVRRVKSVSY